MSSLGRDGEGQQQQEVSRPAIDPEDEASNWGEDREATASDSTEGLNEGQGTPKTEVAQAPSKTGPAKASSKAEVAQAPSKAGPAKASSKAGPAKDRGTAKAGP